jgi:hypothetical protein
VTCIARHDLIGFLTIQLRKEQIMHVTKIVHQLLDATIHKTKIKSLLPVIQAIITSKQLSLTQLGRNLDNKGKERSGIRRIDRLLSNHYYQDQAIDIPNQLQKAKFSEIGSCH